MITKESILACTHYGVQIYAHILRQFYPNETVIKVADKQIKSFCAKEILVNVQHGRYEKIGHW